MRNFVSIDVGVKLCAVKFHTFSRKPRRRYNCASTKMLHVIITLNAIARVLFTVIDLPAERCAVIGLLSAVGDDATREQDFY